MRVLPHQLTAVDAVTAVLGERDRTVLLMACGTGKTRVAGAVAQILMAGGTAERTLLVVPRLRLVPQSLQEWGTAFGAEALGRIVAMCSTREALADTAASMQAVTTDPAEFARLTAGRARTTAVVTYQSLATLAEAHLRYGLPRWGAVLIDEGHHSTGHPDNPWTWAVFDDRVPAERRLTMTATPRNVRGYGAVSLGSERHFGPVAHCLSFGQAITQRLLADYRIVVATPGTDEMRAALADERLYTVGDTTVTAAELAKQLALLRTAHERGIRSVITYHSTVAAAQRFCDTLSHALEHLPPEQRPAELRAGVVHGAQSPQAQRRTLDLLNSTAEGRLTVISNAQMLVEGYDTRVDAVFYADARESLIATIQIAGRALRLDADRPEKTAYFIVPILESEDTDRFDTLIQVVRAMAGHDERLSDSLQEMRFALGTSQRTAAALRRRPGPGQAAPASGALPPWLEYSGSQVSQVPEAFAQQLLLEVVRGASDGFAEFLGAAAVFREDNGHLLVRQDYIDPVTGIALGKWVHNLRTRYKSGQLQAQEIEQVEALGMVWSVPDLEFQQFVEDCQAFKKQHGHLAVPVGTMMGGREFGAQAARRRSNSGWAKVPQDRKKVLLDLGFVLDLREHHYRSGLTAAKAYKARHGTFSGAHANSKNAQARKVADWIARQIRTYRSGSMDPQRATELRELGVALPDATAAEAAGKTRGRPAALDQDQTAEVVRAFGEGTAVKALARQHQVDPKTIRRVLDAASARELPNARSQ